MKFSTQEEYGLRCLLRLAKAGNSRGMTIPEISAVEGLSKANVAKILRILRIGGFIESVRGQAGGYKLKLAPEEMKLSDVLEVLGGKLFDNTFCRDHAGQGAVCHNTIDCSIRSLWRTMQGVLDQVLSSMTLNDLVQSEQKMATQLLFQSEKVLDSFQVSPEDGTV